MARGFVPVTRLQVPVPGRGESLRGGAVPHLQHADPDGRLESRRWDDSRVGWMSATLSVAVTRRFESPEMNPLTGWGDTLMNVFTNKLFVLCCSSSSGRREGHSHLHQSAGHSVSVWRSASHCRLARHSLIFIFCAWNLIPKYSLCFYVSLRPKGVLVNNQPPKSLYSP